MGLSLLGIFHTIIGVIAIFAGLFAFIKFGKISLTNLSGQIYFYFNLISSITALMIYRHGAFTPGHAIGVLVIILMLVAYFLFKKKSQSNIARYFENFTFSLSFFLSMIPTVNETLSRLPVGKPLANGPTDPLVQKTLLVIFVLFVAGSVYQFIKQRKINKTA